MVHFLLRLHCFHFREIPFTRYLWFGLPNKVLSIPNPIFKLRCIYGMIIFSQSELVIDWIILIQSFWLSCERYLNFLNQNMGFFKICLQDWLICSQILKSSTSKLQKTFSARCWRPGLLIIFSMLNAELCSFENHLVNTIILSGMLLLCRTRLAWQRSPMWHWRPAW